MCNEQIKRLSQHSLRGWDTLHDDGYGEIFTPEQEKALFDENNERERKLWGDLLPAKRILQRRGFGVWWADRRLRLVNVGDQILTVAEFKKMSALHKRLSGIK